MFQKKQVSGVRFRISYSIPRVNSFKNLGARRKVNFQTRLPLLLYIARKIIRKKFPLIMLRNKAAVKSMENSFWRKSFLASLQYAKSIML